MTNSSSVAGEVTRPIAPDHSSTEPLSVSDPVFNTPVTRTYGTRVPVVAGALSREIARCKQLSKGRSFGVNVSMLPKLVEGDQVEKTFELIAQEGIRFVETSGRNPEAYLPMLKAAGITVLHKVPSVRYAIKAQS